MILAFAAVLSLAAISCSPKSEYTPGKQDMEDCFGVYFPSQEAGSKTISLEPGDPHRVKITVARELSDVDYDINVPYVLTGDTDVFEVEGDGIVFEGGAATTTFWMNFSDAEVGKKYNCTLEVTDPQYVSNYRTKANYITLNVAIVRWEEIGMATYIDYMFTNTQTGQPLTVQTKVYKNSDDNTTFRVDDPYSEFMAQSGAASSTPAPDYFEFKVLKRGQEFTAFDGAETIMIPVDDLVHYDPFFTSFADPQYGDAYYYHPSLLSGYEDPLTWYDNRVMSWLDAAKTKPGVVQLAPSLYFPNAGGYAPEICINIVFPGAKLTDYSLKVETGLSEDGEVPVSVVLGADVAKVKYAVFSGELDAVKITEKVAESQQVQSRARQSTLQATTRSQTSRRLVCILSWLSVMTAPASRYATLRLYSDSSRQETRALFRSAADSSFQTNMHQQDLLQKTLWSSISTELTSRRLHTASTERRTSTRSTSL